MKKLKLRKPNRVFMATIKGLNSNGQTVFVKDYSGGIFKYERSKDA